MSIEVTHQQSLAHGARFSLGATAEARLTTSRSRSALVKRDTRVASRGDRLGRSRARNGSCRRSRVESRSDRRSGRSRRRHTSCGCSVRVAAQTEAAKKVAHGAVGASIAADATLVNARSAKRGRERSRAHGVHPTHLLAPAAAVEPLLCLFVGSTQWQRRYSAQRVARCRRRDRAAGARRGAGEGQIRSRDVGRGLRAGSITQSRSFHVVRGEGTSSDGGVRSSASVALRR